MGQVTHRMGGILSEPVQGCRSSSDGTGVWGVVQLLELCKFGGPRTRCVYDRGFNADSVDVDHWDEIRGERSVGPELAADERYFI